MMTIKVLRRHEPTGLLEGVRCAYAGEVPLRVWLRLYRRVIKLDRQGYFYPLDVMDAYGEVALKLERLASENPEVENLEASGTAASSIGRLGSFAARSRCRGRLKV